MKGEQTSPLDGWCNFHQRVHPEDVGTGASPNRHDHLEPQPHPLQWFIDNPDCWVVIPARRSTMAETNTLQHWMHLTQTGEGWEDRETWGLTIRTHGEVSLIRDGQTTWAAETAAIRQALETDLPAPCEVWGPYEWFCGEVPALEPEDPRVTAACRQEDVDPAVLTF